MEKKVFISFSSKDQEKANQIVEFIEGNGYRCFISSRDLVAGKEYAGQLIDNILDSEAVVLLLSKTANESPHVLREVEAAVSKKIPIIVYSLEEVALSKSMGYYLMTHQWVPMDDNQNARLLDGLRNISNGCTEPEAVIAAPADLSPKRRKKGRIVAITAAATVLLATGIVFFAVKNAGASSKPKGDPAAPTAAGNVQSSPEDVTSPAPTENATKKEKEPGQSVTFGQYLEAPIEWIVFKKNEDTYTLVSKDILCMKCFDAAEGGEYGYYDGVDYFSFKNHIIDDPALAILVRGNNDWSKSNLRTWLNSDKGVVKYEDQAPTVKAVYSNPYDIEAGFLNGFDEKEKNAMVSVSVETTVNALNEEVKNGKITTNDYVYLLSAEDLGVFETIDMHPYAKPTKNAVNQDPNAEGYRYFHAEYKTENYYYWLRDNDPTDYVNLAYAVATELTPDDLHISSSVGASTYGVRPVITVRKSFFTEEN